MPPWGTAALVILAAGGCLDEGKVIRDLQLRVDQLESDLKQCTQQLADRDGQIAILRRQIDNMQYLHGVEVDDLFLVDRIDLASRTGGADFDGQPGDDGVVVYVRPLDSYGDVLKAAGQITVQLSDLTALEEPKSLGTYIFDDPQVLARSWYGGLLTNHYTLECPLRQEPAPVRTREVHVRVTFLDWLTGREFTASRTIQVKRVDPENTLVPRPPDSARRRPAS